MQQNMHVGGKPPMKCKYGDKCRKWKEGKCTFLHDAQPPNANGQPTQMLQ